MPICLNLPTCPVLSWEALLSGAHLTSREISYIPGDELFDLKILGDTVVDGTGAERFTGDVAIKNGTIAGVRRRGPAIRR